VQASIANRYEREQLHYVSSFKPNFGPSIHEERDSGSNRGVGARVVALEAGALAAPWRCMQLRA